MDRTVFISRLKALRKAAGLKQRELAEKVGVTVQSVKAWEAGKNLPRSNCMALICDFFNCDMEYLLGTQDIPHIYTPKTAIGLPIIEKPEVLETAIKTYGKQAQVDVAIEEMSELIRALLKERRAEKYGRYASEQREAIHGKNGVIEETADVIIMLTQLCMIFGDSDEVQQAIEEKVNRLEKTLARADKGDSGATGEAFQGCIAPAT